MEITIISAFFDINRKDWYGFNRSRTEYLQYFKFWARIKNKLVIFTDYNTSLDIVKIRDDYGLGDRTTVVIVDDYRLLDSDLFKSIQNCMSNDYVSKFRIKPMNPESWSIDYNYIMLMKEWCVCEAIRTGIANGMISWVDFGFNRGGYFYPNSNEFNFLWEYEFNHKIHIFTVGELDNRPIFEIIRTMENCIQGMPIIAPDFLWIKLWKSMRENMISLNKCGLVDDDQTLLLMTYREYPEMFELHKSKWLLPIKEFGGNHLTFNENKGNHKLSSVRNILNLFSKLLVNMKYLSNTYKAINKRL